MALNFFILDFDMTTPSVPKSNIQARVDATGKVHSERSEGIPKGRKGKTAEGAVAFCISVSKEVLLEEDTGPSESVAEMVPIGRSLSWR